MSVVHGFVINPSEKEADKIKKQLVPFWDRPVKNIRNNLKVHITLTLACLPKNKVLKVVKLLEDNKHLFHPVKIRFNMVYPALDKYIMLNCNSDELKVMHDHLLELIQPLTEGEYNLKYLDKDVKHPLSDKEIYYLKKYGYHRVKDFFAPHFTIGKYEDKKIRDSELKYAVLPKGEFTLDIFQLDETNNSEYNYEKILWEARLV